MSTRRATQARQPSGTPPRRSGAQHPRGRRRRARWSAVATCVTVALGLAGAVPAAAAPSPGTGPTGGGAVVSGAVPAGVTFTTVSAGDHHTVALGSDGGVYAWGSNADGQLGDGTTTGSPVPVPVHVPAGVTFTTVTAGANHTVASGSDGHVYTWGDNSRGQLGNHTYTDASLPVQVQAPAGTRYTSVTAGGAHTVASRSDGTTYAWGNNSDGQLGMGTGNPSHPTPYKVAAPTGVTFTTISAGADHTLALGSDGTTYAWGWNHNGQLGDDTWRDSDKPVAVHAPAGVTFTAVSGGGIHTLALGSDGHTYAWGNGSYGQLGTGGYLAGTPRRVQAPAGVTFHALDAGALHSVALGSDGTTYAWGHNGSGRLGDGTTTHTWVPVRTQAPAGVTFAAVTAGGLHSVALGSDGHTYAWGDNASGQLGDGTTTGSLTPAVVPSDVRVTSVAFGGVPATDLTQSGGTWQATTPAGCGPVDVSVEYEQYGTTRTETHPDGHTYGTAPTVVADPGPATLPTGGQVTLAASATGDDAPTVRWQHHDPTGWSDLPGATTTTLDVTTPGEYRAVFTNCRGEATTTTALVSPATADLTATTLTAAPGRVTTGEPATATVHLRDTTGTPLPGQSLTLHLDHPTLATAGPVTDHGDGTYTAPLTTHAPGTLALTVAVNGTPAPATATLHIDPTPDPGPGPGGSPDPTPGTGGGTGGGTGDGTGNATGTGTATTTRPGANDRLAVTGAAVLAAMITALSATALGTVLVHRRRTAD